MNSELNMESGWLHGGCSGITVELKVFLRRQLRQELSNFVVVVRLAGPQHSGLT